MFQTTILQLPLCFETAPELFCPNAVDRGTLAMLAAADFRPGDKVLDLGCGYGPVGIVAARLLGAEQVVMSDISPQAAACARQNAVLNGVGAVSIRVGDGYAAIAESDFTLILSNPPYHTDFSVARRFIETGFHKLVPGGRMLLVTKRRDWYENKLKSVFGGVRVLESDGYFVFISEKRPARAPVAPAGPGLSRKLCRKYARARQSHRGK